MAPTVHTRHGGAEATTPWTKVCGPSRATKAEADRDREAYRAKAKR